MQRLILCLLVILCGSTPAAGEPAKQGALVGRLLVATPEIGDPHFAGTVVLVIQQSDLGAFGIIINRPATEQPIGALLKAIGLPDAKAAGTIELYAGGPVEPQYGFILHSPDYHGADTTLLTRDIALTTSEGIISDIAHAKGPKKTLVAFGYVGWSPGQLDAEIARRDWASAPADAKLVFETDRADVWRLAWARRMIGL
jgi:putative transcriptional regulator